VCTDESTSGVPNFTALSPTPSPTWIQQVLPSALRHADDCVALCLQQLLQVGNHTTGTIKLKRLLCSSTVQCSMLQDSTMQDSTVVQDNVVQCCTVQYSTVQYSTVQYSAGQCSTLCDTRVVGLPGPQTRGWLGINIPTVKGSPNCKP
jgi:hypothetical protein